MAAGDHLSPGCVDVAARGGAAAPLRLPPREIGQWGFGTGPSTWDEGSCHAPALLVALTAALPNPGLTLAICTLFSRTNGLRPRLPSVSSQLSVPWCKRLRGAVGFDGRPVCMVASGAQPCPFPDASRGAHNVAHRVRGRLHATWRWCTMTRGRLRRTTRRRWSGMLTAR